MEHGRRLFRNALAQSGQRPVSLLITIFLTPFILNHLGQEVYGVWALTGSLLTYTGVLALGLNSAVTYRVPRLLITEDHEGIRTVLSTVFGFYCFGSLISLAFGLLLTWKFPDWFKIPLYLHTPARIVVALMAANVALQMPLSLYRGLLSSLQRWDILASTIMASELLRAAAILVALSLGFGVVSLAGISVTASLGVAAASIIFAQKLYPVSIDRHHFQWPMLPQLMNYSLNTLMYSSSQIILMQSGKTLVGLLYGPAAVTVFVIPFMLLIMLSQMVQQAAQTLRPATTMLDGEGQRAAIGQLYVSATKYALMVAIPSSVLFMLWGDRLLKVWVGAELSSQSAAVLFVMTIPQMLRAVNTTGFFVLSGLGQHRFFGQITLAESILSMVLAYLLAGPGGFGLLGIALGISIMELIISGFVVPIHVVRRLDCEMAELGKAALQALAAAIPFALYCVTGSILFKGESRLELLLLLGIAALPFAAGVWFLGLTREERGRLKSYLYPTRGGTVFEP